MGHEWVIYGSHDSYMGYKCGSKWVILATYVKWVLPYRSTIGHKYICVIYVIIMWVSQGINGSYGSYMSQPRCIYKGHLGHIWTINHGSYMGLMGYYEGQKYELNGSFVGQPWCIWVI